MFPFCLPARVGLYYNVFYLGIKMSAYISDATMMTALDCLDYYISSMETMNEIQLFPPKEEWECQQRLIDSARKAKEELLDGLSGVRLKKDPKTGETTKEVQELTYIIEYKTADGFSIKETVDNPPTVPRILRALKSASASYYSGTLPSDLFDPKAREYEYKKGTKDGNIIVLTYEEKL